MLLKNGNAAEKMKTWIAARQHSSKIILRSRVPERPAVKLESSWLTRIAVSLKPRYQSSNKFPTVKYRGPAARRSTDGYFFEEPGCYPPCKRRGNVTRADTSAPLEISPKTKPPGMRCAVNPAPSSTRFVRHGVWANSCRAAWNQIQRLPMSRPRLIGLLLALVTLLVYLPVCRYGFVVYDDGDYVTENHMVQRGLTWSGVKWAFTTWHASNWHPLTWLSHMLDCELFGLNAGAHHSVNVLFHAANAVLLFVLLIRLTKAVAGRVGGRAVCVASAARGIRCLDCRTQGCVKHVFRVAGAFELHAVCGRVRSSKPQAQSLLRFGAADVRARFDGQADVGDAAVCHVVAGLLAAPEGDR